MAGVVNSFLDKALKFVWENHEVVIHGKGSIHNYPNNFMPVIEKIFKDTNFHVVELVESFHKWDDKQCPKPPIYKIIAATMLQNGFKPDKGLGRELQGITKSMFIQENGFRFGLGYMPDSEEVFKANQKKRGPPQLCKLIMNLYQSFPVRNAHAQ
ncbi:hypothetical protein RND71_030681 [Anisodus tanguticus]|uniref:G-patch domain-containing protein n=1 Tax=Anisodus tanguticus TaxID=243964 RepID=A0AAE1UZY1_9SOLA|nr:hypothetical protein RND71_030681 [Anisodus tanguticus]